MNFREKFKVYQNYVIIAILSLISILFLPMLSSEVGIGFNLPNTVAGWIVYVLTKLSIVLINVLMLDQFIKQAKINVSEDKNFKEANEYFNENDEEKDEVILTPKQYIGRIYRRKMISTAMSSILGVFGLTQAILSFDWVAMLTYIFTVVFGLVYGWIIMNEVEYYWTNTYYKLYRREKKKCLSMTEKNSET